MFPIFQLGLMIMKRKLIFANSLAGFLNLSWEHHNHKCMAPYNTFHICKIPNIMIKKMNKTTNSDPISLLSDTYFEASKMGWNEYEYVNPQNLSNAKTLHMVHIILFSIFFYFLSLYFENQPFMLQVITPGSRNFAWNSALSSELSRNIHNTPSSTQFLHWCFVFRPHFASISSPRTGPLF